VRFDCGILVVAGFIVAFLPGLDVGEMDPRTEFTSFRCVNMST
jgi:hypothetical protein